MKESATYRHKILLSFVLGLLSLACICNICNLSLFDKEGPPKNAVIINVVANTSLKPWLETAIVNFNEKKVKTDEGKAVYVQLNLIEAGQSVVDMTNGTAPLPELWIPDDQVWTEVLADKGYSQFLDNCASVSESPLVIAMWQPIAEALGWPSRSLGWLDVGSLAADPSAWDYYSGGQFGDKLRLSHTHPGLSNSGVSTLIAIVQAAEGKEEAVNADEMSDPVVQASVNAFEAAVSWFGTSTHQIGQTMNERGIGYLGAAVVYESTVVNHGNSTPRLIPIYPFEGTFMATHPACLNNENDPHAEEAAIIFREYLLGEEAQQLAVAHGLRPTNKNVSMETPLDESHGVDLTQPEVIFASPSVESIYAIQDLWQSARKSVNLVMVLDTSGSMMGRKIENMRQAAGQFIEQMGENDYISVVSFSDQPVVLAHHVRIGEGGDAVAPLINALEADGGTAFYDAIGKAANIIGSTMSPETSNVIVALTDGMDTNSSFYSFNTHLIETATANDTTIFTIAYGSDADEDILEDIALQANGNFYLGNGASIAAIYQEMSAAFGGSVGIGR